MERVSSALPLSQHQGSNFIIFHKICLTTAVKLVARHGQMFMLFKWGSKACWVNVIKESWGFLLCCFCSLSSRLPPCRSSCFLDETWAAGEGWRGGCRSWTQSSGVKILDYKRNVCVWLVSVLPDGTIHRWPVAHRFSECVFIKIIMRRGSVENTSQATPVAC